MRRWYFKLLLLCFWLFTQCRSPYLIKKAKLFLLNCSRCGWWEQDLIRMLARVWKAVSFICVFLHKAEPGLIFKCYGPKGKQRINFFSFSFGWETDCSVVTARKKNSLFCFWWRIFDKSHFDIISNRNVAHKVPFPSVTNSPLSPEV